MSSVKKFNLLTIVLILSKIKPIKSSENDYFLLQKWQKTLLQKWHLNRPANEDTNVISLKLSGFGEIEINRRCSFRVGWSFFKWEFWCRRSVAKS